ncbi:hypothetical protein [uncultured Corynebacterium sp.]|uniref:hypothetical protein n=1 Tax=uncultured Corynebacterium sp. TaxID=159447 RepID=UPI002632CD13|nr:hypothetical protein [uncultured Corynebacterium sp.]
MRNQHQDLAEAVNTFHAEVTRMDAYTTDGINKITRLTTDIAVALYKLTLTELKEKTNA